MADFKAALNALARGDLEFEAIATNLSVMLDQRPQAANSIMEEVRDAYSEDLIDAATYARLKKIVVAHSNVTSSVADNSDATRFDTGSPGSEPNSEETEFLPDIDNDSIAAEARAAHEATLAGDTSLDFDLTAGSEPLDDSSPVLISAMGAAERGTPDLANAGESEGKLGPGSVLKDRFQIDDVLGVGGMGTVYRGRDLIKVEARDRNPYVAVKVLNEDFKKHPDSFIALQREASRQQRLAHPNIATVYDFDRTRGGTVFLTMELLEGEPLNTFIKKKVRPQGGLPFAEAFPMIEGLGKALIYAHEHHIVHSDFKPGNCFQTNEGVMKVLDFGIARAVKNPAQADGEKTLFDAGDLGALTPAYASAEMMEGEEPDPRDDLYALACVSYELLTGKHPFNKLPANSARDNNLIPLPVKGLKRRQMKGLMRGLAFARADRSRNVAEFLHQLEGRTSTFTNPYIMIPAAIVVVALAGVAPTLNYLHEREIEQQIEWVNSGDHQQIELFLETLERPEVDAADRDRILVATRVAILDYFQEQINQRVDVAAGRFNFVGANAIIDRVTAMDVFKDSAQVQSWRETTENAESVLLNEQTVLFNEALAARHLLPIDDEDDVHDALDIIAQFAPAAVDSLKRRLPGHYAAAIDRAIVNEEFDLADNLKDAGLSIIPDNKNLINLVAKISGARERTQTARDILAYTARIQAAIAGGSRLAAFLPIRKDVKNLSRIDPSNELLQALTAIVAPLVDKEIAALSAKRNWGRSDLVQNDYRELLLSLGLRVSNTRASKLRHEFDREVAAVVTSISIAVAADKLAPPASPNATELIAQLESMAPTHTRTVDARETVARGYLDDVRMARANQDFAAAELLLGAAQKIAGAAPVVTSLELEQDIIAGDKGADAAQLEQRINNRKAEFEQALPVAEQAFAALAPTADAIALALARYDALTSLDPANEHLPALRSQLIDGISKVSDQFGLNEQWDAAVKVTRDTLAYAPDSESLSSKLVTLETRQREAALEEDRRYVADRKQEVESLLSDATATSAWSAGIQRNMADIQILAEADDPWIAVFKRKIASVYVVKATAAREAERFAEGANLLDRAERYVPDLEALGAERVALAVATDTFEREQREQERLARIEGLKQDFETQAKANDVRSAGKTLTQLRQDLGEDDPFVTTFGPRKLANAYYKLATRKAGQQDFSAALKLAKAGLKLQPNRQELRLAVKDYTVDGNKQELDKTFGRGGAFDLEAVLNWVSEVQTLDPRAYSASELGWAQAVASRLEVLQKAVGDASNTLLDRAQEVFAGNPLIAAIEHAGPVFGEAPPIAAEIKAAMDAALLGKARSLLKGVASEDAQHAAIIQLKGAYNARINEARSLYGDYKAAFVAKDYDTAKATIDKALSLWGDSTTFSKERARVLAALKQPPSIGRDGKIIEAPPPPSKSPCTRKLAGHGKRKKGTCYDMISSSARGPVMVVVPSGAEFAQPFAIGKYEITVGDFNKYCASSGTCQTLPDRETRLPITGISFDQATAYAQWLTDRTGNIYRLPTVQEWTYAAESGGQQPRKDYNCRVEQGGQILKGQSTMGVNTGKANGWGLYNYVGNVQEWVRTSAGVVVRGGAFEDTFGKCSIALEKPHAGTPDHATGFRLLQELG